jgi:hypothetical protein
MNAHIWASYFWVFIAIDIYYYLALNEMALLVISGPKWSEFASDLGKTWGWYRELVISKLWLKIQHQSA